MKNPFFTSTNYKLLGITILVLIIGYILLGQGPVQNHISWSIAPIILITGYCVLVPITILYKDKQKDDTAKKDKGV